MLSDICSESCFLKKIGDQVTTFVIKESSGIFIYVIWNTMPVWEKYLQRDNGPNADLVGNAVGVVAVTAIK